ncbi:MAG: tetratricopeptide repeat protein [Gammaproteobacteria bacterium]
MKTVGRGPVWAAAILLGLMVPVQADYESGVKAYTSGDYESALGEFGRAADGGDRNAQYNVGLMHLKGQGVAANDKEAVRWFRKAAGLGQVEAQTFLGALYADGQGVAQDYEQAAYWLAMAAEAGRGAAQCFLGQLYADGLGVEEDRVEAYAWLSVSEVNGYPEAAGLLKEVAASMSPGDIERARRLAQVRGPNWARQGESTLPVQAVSKD